MAGQLGTERSQTGQPLRQLKAAWRRLVRFLDLLGALLTMAMLKPDRASWLDRQNLELDNKHKHGQT